MSGPFTTHQGKSINVGPFVVLMPDGVTVDTTTPITVITANTNINVGVLGTTSPDNRFVFVDGLTPVVAANVIISVTEGGTVFHDSFLVGVLAPPNLGGVSSTGATASDEYTTPTTR